MLRWLWMQVGVWMRARCPFGWIANDVLAAIDDAALKAQPKWPSYFYGGGQTQKAWEKNAGT
jgi:hypothetical protein